MDLTLPWVWALISANLILAEPIALKTRKEESVNIIESLIVLLGDYAVA